MLDCRVRVGENCRVGENAASGKGIALLGAGLVLPDKTVIGGGVMTSVLPKEDK
jgi:hypothetical protein